MSKSAAASLYTRGVLSRGNADFSHEFHTQSKLKFDAGPIYRLERQI